MELVVCLRDTDTINQATAHSVQSGERNSPLLGHIRPYIWLELLAQSFLKDPYTLTPTTDIQTLLLTSDTDPDDSYKRDAQCAIP